MQGCRVVNEEEVNQLLKKLGIRDRVLVMTGLTFGTRVSETLSLTFGDVEGKYLSIKSKKNSENITFPVPEGYKKLVEELKRIYKLRGFVVTSDTPLFLSLNDGKKGISRKQISQVIKDACKKLNIQGKVNTHSFRKAFVTKIYNMTGKDIAQTQMYSRHKNLSNLQTYIQTTESTDLVNKLSWGI